MHGLAFANQPVVAEDHELNTAHSSSVNFGDIDDTDPVSIADHIIQCEVDRLNPIDGFGPVLPQTGLSLDARCTDSRFRARRREDYAFAEMGKHRFQVFAIPFGNPAIGESPGVNPWTHVRSSQNFVTSVKLNSLTFIAGTTMSNDSSPHARTGTLIASTLESIWIKLSLKRKLRTPPRKRPFAIRNVPSRVMPVSTFSKGSTSRM